MRRAIFGRPLSDAEREDTEVGLRSSEAFVLRRYQVLLASARGGTFTRWPLVGLRPSDLTQI
jgi:hypothetical protein